MDQGKKQRILDPTALATSLAQFHRLGIRMAVGARPRDILRQFLVEASVIALIGAVIGVLLGVLLAYTIAAFAGWAVAWSLAVILVAVLVCAGLGWMAGKKRTPRRGSRGVRRSSPKCASSPTG